LFSALKKSLASQSTFADIQADILAGLTVGVIALPLSMALAIAVIPPFLTEVKSRRLNS
jgi:SulP family sulfate permease